MWQPEKPKVSWIEWVFLVLVVVGSLIGVGYTLVSVGLVDIGGGENTPQPTISAVTPVATQKVVVSTNTPMPADTPVVVSAAPLPTRQPLVVSVVEQPAWLAISSGSTSHEFSDLGLVIRCAGTDGLKLDVGDEVEVASVRYRRLILIRQDSDFVYVRIDPKCRIGWLAGEYDPNYATFHISRNGDEVSWGYNPDPGPHSVIE